MGAMGHNYREILIICSAVPNKNKHTFRQLNEVPMRDIQGSTYAPE